MQTSFLRFSIVKQDENVDELTFSVFVGGGWCRKSQEMTLLVVCLVKYFLPCCGVYLLGGDVDPTLCALVRVGSFDGNVQSRFLHF